LRCGFGARQLLKFSEESVAAIGMTILIVGGGGGFAHVLQTSGAADAMGAMAAGGPSDALAVRLDGVGLHPRGDRFRHGFHHDSLGADGAGAGRSSRCQSELVVISIGCGSLFLSHLNDGGFWIVKDCLNLTVAQTFRTWSVCETIIGLVGPGVDADGKCSHSMTPPFFLDAHLDLALNAMEWNRDLTRPIAEIRAAESGLRDKAGRGRGTVCLPEMRRGRVGLAVVTQLRVSTEMKATTPSQSGARRHKLGR
jgi:hypothetical protein